MKWIDNQEDYFLRDFDSHKEDTQGAATGQPTGQNDDTEGAPVSAADTPADTPAAGDEAPASNEFSFTPDTPVTPEPTGKPRTVRRRFRRRLAWFFIILFVVLAVAFYIRYFVPYTSDTLTSGYVTLVEKRGIFFKTFEGEMISESMLTDTTKVYSRDFYFSIPNDSLGRLVQSYQGTGKRVVLTTQKYFGTVPWRGSHKSVVTAVRPAD